MKECTCDNGKITLTSQILTKDGLVPQEPVIMNCLWCNGTGTMTDEEAKLRQSINDAWCKCEDSSGSSYYEEGRSHGWTCNDCGKLTQVG
jgi:hypothetical protein